MKLITATYESSNHQKDQTLGFEFEHGDARHWVGATFTHDLSPLQVRGRLIEMIKHVEALDAQERQPA